MRGAAYAIGGVVAGFALASAIRSPSASRCCDQLAQLVRADLGKRCGSAAAFCEGVGGALGLNGKTSSRLLDLFGVTKP